MKQTEAEVLEILTKISKGAKWEFLSSREQWTYPRDLTLGSACRMTGWGHELRLKKEPKMVPLGPEDFVGQCWWLRDQDGGRLHMLTCTADWNFSTIMKNGWERTKDGKNWELCQKLED